MSDWVQLDSTQFISLKSETAISCTLGKVYTYLERRNAYHGTPTIGASGTGWNIEEMKTHIEKLRVQGSHFEIVETPAVLIRGSSTTLLAAQGAISPQFKWGGPPFKKHGRIKFAGTSLGSLATTIHEAFPYTVLFASESQVYEATLPFQNHDSYTSDPGLPLGWWRKQSGCELRYILLTCARICVVLNREFATKITHGHCEG